MHYATDRRLIELTFVEDEEFFLPRTLSTDFKEI